MTKRGRLYVGAGVALSLGFDLAIAYVGNRLTRTEFTDDTMAVWVWFGLIVAGQFVAGFYMSMKRAALLFAYTDKVGSERIAAALDRAGFPSPHLYDSAMTYLDTVADNPDLDVGVRIKAAHYKGEVDGYNAAKGFFAGLRLIVTWDDAIKILANDRNIRKPD